MESKIILLDTSVLIDYFRKKEKQRSFLFHLAEHNNQFGISAITKFEILTGANPDQKIIWNKIFKNFLYYDFTNETSELAAEIDFELKKKRKQIALPDLFIAATAIHNKLPLGTLNKKHFERIENLKILTPTD